MMLPWELAREITKAPARATRVRPRYSLSPDFRRYMGTPEGCWKGGGGGGGG